MASKQIRIGVFMPLNVQLLDLATVDVLASMSKEYLSLIPLPAHISELAPSTKITYITSPKLFPHVDLTADLSVRATHTFEDKDVAPGQLDIIVVPGTEPAVTFEEGALKWLRDHFNTEGVDVLCVCTGVYLCGAAGILNGRNVSGPRGLQDDLIKKYPDVKFVGDEYRWIQDGNLWSSGGITNGNDLMAAYARASSKHWPRPVADMGAMLVDVGDRSQIYGQGQRRFYLGVAWHIIKDWFLSLVPFRKYQSKKD
ncbi:hypothetical protein FSARC_7782 [Fusarium sarcochroum]|uniref:DJ-1/PfpI domain-containing protein n=1 Tax=Fusarium sarcochroum TaxID=1208366 RepID=A0A8H4TUJ8_9HYPO|nr:hypothetical protein FSARC_7782 [Fusarium sarcochroum]